MFCFRLKIFSSEESLTFLLVYWQVPLTGPLAFLHVEIHLFWCISIHSFAGSRKKNSCGKTHFCLFSRREGIHIILCNSSYGIYTLSVTQTTQKSFQTVTLWIFISKSTISHLIHWNPLTNGRDIVISSSCVAVLIWDVLEQNIIKW